MLSLLRNVQDIRILPMSKTKEFDNATIEEIQQDYFSYQLILRQGKFWYRKSGLNVQKPALILFQYDNHIIAGAVLEDTVKNDQLRKGYSGYFRFNVQSIAVLTPITYNELAQVFIGLHRFTREKQKLDIANLPQLITLMKNKNVQFVLPSYLAQENQEQFQKSLHSIITQNTPDVPMSPKDPFTGSKTVTPRDPGLSKGALESANYQCEYDSSHMYFISESTKENYVEAHHLIPLSKQREFNYSLDVSANIVSLCPVCHKKIHHAEDVVREPIIKHLLNARINRLNDAGIGISPNNLLKMYE
jgi:5-methylcytosine-specific restriction protein A